MTVVISVDKLLDALSDVLDEYKDLVTIATESGLDEAAQVFIKNAPAFSPKKTGKYARNWRVKQTKKKYRLRRYVGNTTKVEDVEWEKQIPLINILEYSTIRAKPHVQKIFDASVEGMIDAIKRNLKGA